MFSKLSNTLQAAADIVAPPCARVDDFKYHWQQVQLECEKSQENGKYGLIAAEETHAPKHLKQMLRVLVEDVADSNCGNSLTSCLEFVIQERILVSMVSFAWADRPLGIRQYVFIFLSKILQHLHHTYLHQMRVHKPLQAMIKATCEKKASPYENQEIEFLSIVCEKIREDSSIILLYIEPMTLTADISTGFTPIISGVSTPRNTCVQPESDDECSNSSETTLTPGCDRSLESENIGSKFPLVEALINLCHSNDATITARAHECLMTITQLQESRSSSAVAKHTLLAHYIASRLTTVAESIPLDTEPALVENINIFEPERLDVSSSESEGDEDTCVDFPGRKEVAEFLRWLHLFDKLIGGCNSLLGTSICSIIRELFLDGFVYPHFASDADEDVVSLFTGLLSKMLLVVSSQSLTNCISSWLTDDSDYDEVKTMKKMLLERCRTPPHHIQVESLRLLQVLLERQGSFAVQILALNYVGSRAYFDSSSAENRQDSWSDEEDERYKHREETDFSPGVLPISRTLAPPNISKIVKRFLSLVPEDIRSTSNEDFDSYKADAQRQYRDACRRTSFHAWPREAVSPEAPSDACSTASRDSRTESEGTGFIEGPLLQMLLDFLEQLPEQDYDINLQVTSLVSSLALLPHPHLHEFLLNPTLPLSPGVRTPYTVMEKVITRIHESISSKENFRNYLKLTRFQLLGTMHELEYERDDEDSKFEALIVIEEFAKELAAIAYAKYTCEGNF